MVFQSVYYALKSPSRPGEQGKYLGLDFMAVSLVLIGIFSSIFHATLHQGTQFLDEMSMFFLGTALLQPLLTAGSHEAGNHSSPDLRCRRSLRGLLPEEGRHHPRSGLLHHGGSDLLAAALSDTLARADAGGEVEAGGAVLDGDWAHGVGDCAVAC